MQWLTADRPLWFFKADYQIKVVMTRELSVIRAITHNFIFTNRLSKTNYLIEFSISKEIYIKKNPLPSEL